MVILNNFSKYEILFELLTFNDPIVRIIKMNDSNEIVKIYDFGVNALNLDLIENDIIKNCSNFEIQIFENYEVF